MPTKSKNRATGKNNTKRHASHHKVGKHYLKVYWPYVPMLLIVGVGILLGGPRQDATAGVLSYATEMSRTQLLQSTNLERSKAGAPTLKLNDQLSKAAQAKAQDMVAKNYWSHYTPTGDAPWVFVDATGYTYSKAGENLAYGFASSKDTVTGWMNSKTHKENLLDTAYSEVGFGYANSPSFNGSGKETVVVAMYGQPSPATAASATIAANDGPYSTAFASGIEPDSTAISLAQKLTGGATPWIAFVFGTVSGALLLLLIIRHGFAFKRVLVHGEQFFLKHPLLDIAFVGIIMVGYVFSQTNGFIR